MNAAPGFRQPAARRGVLAVSLWLAVTLLGNGGYGLFESSEARYAEVAREMSASGDWLTPTLNGAPHFTKPPLATWGTAAAIRLFGATPFAVRLFPTLCGALTLLLVARLAGDFGWRDDAAWGVLALGSALLFNSTVRIPTTDPLVLLLDVLCVFSYWRARGRGGALWPLLAWLAVGLLLLAKGPAGILVPLLVIPLHRLFDSDRPRMRRPRWVHVAGPGLALAAALPWYLAVWNRHPGLFSYMIGHEAAEAAVNAERFHAGPWYYYAGVLFAGLFPWCLCALGMKPAQDRAVLRLLWIWALVPVLVFSAFPAKLATYVLPVAPAWVLLGLDGLRVWNRFQTGKPALLSTAAIAGLVGLGFAAAPWLPGLAAPPVAKGVVAGMGLGLILWAARWVHRVLRNLPVHPGLPALVMLCLASAIPFLCAMVEPELKIPRPAVHALMDARHPGEPVVAFHTTVSSAPFFLQEPVYSVGAFHIDRKYVPPTLPDWFLRDDREVSGLVSQKGSALVLVDPRMKMKDGTSGEEELARRFPRREEVYRGKRYLVLRVFPQGP